LKEGQPTDPFGNPLSDLLSKLPVTAAVLAAKDIDLAAEPEAGQAGEIAAVLDQLEDIRKKEAAAEKEAEEASLAAEEMMEAWRRAIEAGDDQEEIRRLRRASVEAKNKAVQAGRKAAKMAAVAEHLVETARRLGHEFEDAEKIDEQNGPGSDGSKPNNQ
ncbi:MAG: hypothetical protein ACLFUP_04230, partial [Desulfobacteraceae bacterium]